MRSLDTTVAVDVLRAVPPATALLEQLLTGDEEIVASEAVRFELLAGALEPERPRVESFFQTLSWMPVDEHVSRTAGDLARRYRAAFSGIGDVDYLIAATALVLDADLMTTNVRHFPMLEGLQPAY